MARVAKAEEDIKSRVAGIIRELRPAVQGDGGDIELVDVSEDGVVSVRFHGACVGCPSSDMTLKLGIEQTLKHRLPQVREVICV